MSVSSPKSVRQLRAGVIGTGFIGPVHIEALRRLGVQVGALCDLPERVRDAAARLGIPQAYGDYRELLRSPEINVMHITAPNRYHCEMSLAALAAGKHCICEKPLAMDTRQTGQVLKRARETATVFAVNYNARFYPAVLQLRRMVGRGELGDIIHVNGSYLQDWLFKETDYNWRLLPEEGGRLRAVADIGTHWMDTVSFILGARITSVFADLATWHKTRQRPLGEVQTFRGAGEAARYAPYRVKTEDFASVLLPNSAQEPAPTWPSHRLLPDGRTASGSRFTARKNRPGGAPRTPNCSITEIVTPPTKSLCAARRRLVLTPRPTSTTRPATWKDSPTPSRCTSARCMRRLPERQARDSLPPLKTDTGKPPCAKPS